jgi:hypothetical protein
LWKPISTPALEAVTSNGEASRPLRLVHWNFAVSIFQPNRNVMLDGPMLPLIEAVDQLVDRLTSGD